MRFPAPYAWAIAAAAAGGATLSYSALSGASPRRHSSAAAAAAATTTTERPPTAPTADNPTPWVILGSIPRVAPLSGGGGGAEKARGDLSLALAAPPRVSRLAVSERVFPSRPTPQSFPFVLAADPSGLLLLSAILSTPPRRIVIDRPGRHQSVRWEDTDPRYYVLDAATGTAFRLPDPAPQETIEHQALVGLVARPAAAGGGGGGFMVAELLPIIGSDRANLRCYSSDVGEWVDKRVRYPLPPRPLAPICTISHQGRLWWADYSWGIITADPFADNPVVRLVPLPPPCVLKCREAWGVLDEFRYVGVSAGKLRFVDTYRRGGDPTKVTVWTLPDADAKEWKLEHEATFADIWADDTYKATGLPKKAPVLAVIHPHNPAIVYFFLEGHLFAVDVPARKVVECDRYNLVAPPPYHPISNRFIRAWELPRAISSGTYHHKYHL
jgi:hypothetical protein